VPPARVWHRIAAAAEAEPRVSWLKSGWLNWRPVTAVAMTALIAASLWRVGTLLGPVAEPRSAGTTVASAAPTSGELGPESDYTMAIAQLEQVANADRDVLDQDTAGVLHAGLTVIDGAISESRAALDAEPQSESAQESLFAALRRKVALLQETVALINETRNGDQDRSARILPEINEDQVPKHRDRADVRGVRIRRLGAAAAGLTNARTDGSPTASPTETAAACLSAARSSDTWRDQRSVQSRCSARARWNVRAAEPYWR
jgi:hypothetical protein